MTYQGLHAGVPVAVGEDAARVGLHLCAVLGADGGEIPEAVELCALGVVEDGARQDRTGEMRHQGDAPGRGGLLAIFAVNLAGVESVRLQLALARFEVVGGELGRVVGVVHAPAGMSTRPYLSPSHGGPSASCGFCQPFTPQA